MPFIAPDGRSLRFGVAMTCIDGRVQRPVVDYLRRTYGFDYVDLVTEPGPELILTNPSAKRIRDWAQQKFAFSVKAHQSEIAVITAHDGCAANSADPDTRMEQLKEAEELLRKWNLGVDILALWVGSRGEITDVSEGALNTGKKPQAYIELPRPRVAAPAQPARLHAQPEGPEDDRFIAGLIGFALGVAASKNQKS